MASIDYKELSNPLILMPLILLASYLSNIKGLDIIFSSSIIFLGISFTLNIFLIIFKITKKRLYLFIYGAYIFHLIFIIPFFYTLKLKNPIIYALFILGLTEFVILTYYNITNRKDGKEIVKLWKNKLIKSERVWFHPIALQKYKFKDFTISITDSKAINPTNCHITHLRPLKYEKIPSHIFKHQYGGNAYRFNLFLNDPKLKIKKENKTINKLKTNKEILKHIKKIKPNIKKNLITAYKQGSNKKNKNDSAILKGENNITLLIKKDFVKKNPDMIYKFLKNCNKKFNSKP